MMTFNQVKSSVAAFMMVLVGLQATAQSFWSQDFGSQATATTNWVTTGSNNGGGTSNWEWTVNPNAGFQDGDGDIGAFVAPTAANGYFVFNSEGNFNFRHDMKLTGVGVPANCTGKNNVHLRFYAEYIHFTQADTSIVEVGISTNGTDFTYTEVLKQVAAGAIFENQVDIAAPTANNKAQVWVQIRWRGQEEYHLKIDDLEFYNAPLACAQDPNSIICDNFDTYVTTQKLAQQSPTNWGVWSNAAGGGTEDGVIVTTPVSSAPNALKVEATSATPGAGPMDLVLKLQNKTTGNYSLKWKMNIPTGKQGYFNIQGTVPIPATPIFNGEYYFTNGGKGFGISAGDTLGTWTFPYGTWFDFEQTFDLDNNVHKIFVNGVKVATIPYSGNLGGIDFFGVNNTYQYFVDDLEYVSLPSVVYNVDGCPTAVDVSVGLGNATGVVTNFGPYDITNATVDPTDPTTGFACHFQGDILQGTQWFTFVGDGKRYIITSADCGATPIVGGDNQFALYTGSCGAFVPVACNDDLSGTDLHASLTFLTTAGTTYYLMVDPFNNLPGTYCLNIAQVGNITCAQGTIGTNAVSNNGNLCFGENLNTILSVTPATYVLPNTLTGVNGHMWYISNGPIAAGTWPDITAAGGGQLSTFTSPVVTNFNIVHNGANINPGVYYLTSIVVAGGALINPAQGASVFNIDPANGCFFIGQSHQISLLPELTPIAITGTTTAVTAPGWNGSININATGGSAGLFGIPYTYQWSNGGTTDPLTGLAPGTYTVTITEPSGCVDNGTATFTVTGFVSGTTDPAVLSAMSITPNPTTGVALINMQLAQSAEVRIDIVNALGQVVITRHLGNTTNVNQEVDLSNFADGTYFMRATLDNETAIRTIVVNR
jgi:Secretion system C-terminal sorting domain